VQRPPFSSYDSFEPVMAWKLALPPGADARAAARAILDAGEATELFVVGEIEAAGARTANAHAFLESLAASVEPLPFADAFYGEGGRVLVETRVTYRNADDALKSERVTDAGALLRRLVPDAEPIWLRRFAASHPFVAIWSTTHEGACTFTLAFWTSLFLDDHDAPVHQENRGRLLKLRAQLVEIAKDAHGELLAPMA
jgi:hypothetical protein